MTMTTETKAPATMAVLTATIERVEKAREELFQMSSHDGLSLQARAAYRDASRAIATALAP